MNVVEAGGVSYRMTGPTHMLIPEAAHLSLPALQMCLIHLLFSREDIEPSDLVTAQAVGQLTNDAGAAFERAWQAIQDAEEQRLW